MAPEHNNDIEVTDSGNEKTLGYISEFSNGIFAFAITLLVLDLRLPAETSKANLGSSLLSMWPNYLAFLISFFVIGLFWSVFIRLFKEIIRTDRNFIFLLLLYLLFIVVIPFSTSLLSLHLATISAVVYAALMACAGYAQNIIRIYASRNHRLISKKHSPQSIRKGIQLGLIMPVWFTVSIAIAFFSPLGAQISWILFLIVYSFLWRFTKDKALI
jgi:uncharacterized membrane protein